MKQIIIFLLVIIVALIGYGQYSQYKRYNSPDVNYTTDRVLKLDNQNPEVLKNYYDAIENLNSFVMMQWSANGIDVRTPKDDDAETKIAIDTYSEKLSYIKYLENKLAVDSNSVSNFETNSVNATNLNLTSTNKIAKIKSLFNPCIKLYNGQKNPLIFEVQKQLNKLGHKVKLDGVYRYETLNAIKKFEGENNLLADGLLDNLTIEMMFQ